MAIIDNRKMLDKDPGFAIQGINGSDSSALTRKIEDLVLDIKSKVKDTDSAQDIEAHILDVLLNKGITDDGLIKTVVRTFNRVNTFNSLANKKDDNELINPDEIADKAAIIVINGNADNKNVVIVKEASANVGMEKAASSALEFQANFFLQSNSNREKEAAILAPSRYSELTLREAFEKAANITTDVVMMYKRLKTDMYGDAFEAKAKVTVGKEKLAHYISSKRGMEKENFIVDCANHYGAGFLSLVDNRHLEDIPASRLSVSALEKKASMALVDHSSKPIQLIDSIFEDIEDKNFKTVQALSISKEAKSVGGASFFSALIDGFGDVGDSEILTTRELEGKVDAEVMNKLYSLDSKRAMMDLLSKRDEVGMYDIKEIVKSFNEINGDYPELKYRPHALANTVIQNIERGNVMTAEDMKAMSAVTDNINDGLVRVSDGVSDGVNLFGGKVSDLLVNATQSVHDTAMDGSKIVSSAAGGAARITKKSIDGIVSGIKDFGAKSRDATIVIAKQRKEMSDKSKNKREIRIAEDEIRAEKKKEERKKNDIHIARGRGNRVVNKRRANRKAKKNANKNK